MFKSCWAYNSQLSSLNYFQFFSFFLKISVISANFSLFKELYTKYICNSISYMCRYTSLVYWKKDLFSNFFFPSTSEDRTAKWDTSFNRHVGIFLKLPFFLLSSLLISLIMPPISTKIKLKVNVLDTFYLILGYCSDFLTATWSVLLRP